MTANDQATLVVLEVALEMSERGVVMKPIDIYASEASSCVITDNAIIPPFTAFPGLGDSVAESIIAARKEGPFSSREDFQRRTLCNRTLLENMTEAGLLSSMPASDQLDMWEMAAAPAIHPESPAPATETKPEQEPVLSDQSNQSDESDKPGMQDDAGSVDFFAVDEAPVADEKPAIDETRAESAKPSAPKKPARVRDTQPDLGMELF